MPQATTTSVALGPVADLTSPAAQSTGPDKDQPSFDTLLRPAARNKPAVPTKSSGDSADPARNQAQAASTEVQPGSLEAEAEGNDPSLPQADQSPAADELLVESLAGLAAITPQIIVVEPPIVIEEGTDAGDRVQLAASPLGEHLSNRSALQATSAAGEPASTVIGVQMRSDSGEQAPRTSDEQATSPPQLTFTKTAEVLEAISETSVTPNTPIANVGQSKLPLDATVDARFPAKSTPAESRTHQSPDVFLQPVTATKTIGASAVKPPTTAETASEANTGTTSQQASTAQKMIAVETASAETPVPAPESPASSLTRLENPSPEAASQSTTDSRDQTNNDSGPSENQGQSETAAIELAAETENAAALPPTAAETKTPAPVAAPTASPIAHADSHQFVATSGAATALAALPSPRIRLPANVLAQPATASNRRSTPAIDTKSLLNRVTRAFAAAQERDGEIRLRLSPPELGSLRLDVRIQDGVMVARLQTETDAARTAIIENLPALRDRLSEQGVRIERFDVDLMHRQAGGTPDQPGRQQPEPPLAPPRVVPAPRPRPATAPVARPSPAAASTGGLNVIV